MFMEIPKLSIRFIDSLNFLQMPLKSFSKTFGMSEGVFSTLLQQGM